MVATITQTPSTQGLTDISGLMEMLTGQYGKGVSTREDIYKQGLGVMQNVAQMMAGPEFDKYAEEMYESAKRKGVGAGVSRLISSGLMGTTRAAEPERAFEREVGTPFRLGLAEQKAGRIASALSNMANYMSAFQQPYPEAGTLAYLATGGFGALSPEQKLAAQELPYLMQAAQQGGGGTGFMQSTTGGGGGGGGGGTLPWSTSTGYSSGVSGGTTGGTGGYSPVAGSGVSGGTTFANPMAVYGEPLSNLSSAAANQPLPATGQTFANPMAVYGDPYGGTLATSQPGAELSGANTPRQVGETKTMTINGKQYEYRWTGGTWVPTTGQPAGGGGSFGGTGTTGSW